eukprot:CAMPEP_0203677332 /NCGR_PEP_ID=MMETSP0090-20130426/27803_1 /ASSEMBLY_ACC=CAM_ASM_001088 /TAXON_ID=426623 /ORGANISM="Chaetoceros affinis, Strain CCMP159" /LENGTH=60 /DNA_ID=CAMNT_0050544189 /DNA_START=60 /DNA_END=238 /DNA_ORIENTATION=-
MQQVMCADPRDIVATEMCCAPGWEDDEPRSSSATHGLRFCQYYGERVKYDSAVSRCAENG